MQEFRKDEPPRKREMLGTEITSATVKRLIIEEMDVKHSVGFELNRKNLKLILIVVGIILIFVLVTPIVLKVANDMAPVIKEGAFF